MTVPVVDRPRVLLLGGSTAHGLGVHRRSWGVRAAELLDAGEVLDLTSSGPLVDEDVAHLDQVAAFRPDVALISVGIAEQIVHATPVVQQAIERFAPAGWHGVAGLQPRPYFSTSRRRALRQKLVSRAKTVIKRTALRLGGSPRMPLDEVRTHVATLLEALDHAGVTTLVMGTFPVDEALFPGTPAAFASVQELLRDAVAEVPSARLVVPDVAVWGDYLADHMHWNDAGHDRVAAQVVAELSHPTAA